MIDYDTQSDLLVFQVELRHSSNVTAVLERGALLNCRVRGIGNRTVSLDDFIYLFEKLRLYLVGLCVTPLNFGSVTLCFHKMLLQL